MTNIILRLTKRNDDEKIDFCILKVHRVRFYFFNPGNGFNSFIKSLDKYSFGFHLDF